MLVADSAFGTGEVLWDMFWFFLFIIWIWVLFGIFADIFRSKDLSGWGKALWTIFVVVVPWLGVLVYLIVRGTKMHERAQEAARANDAAFRQYVQDAAKGSTNGAGSPADELTKLADLKDKGLITEDEFQTQKAKILT